MPEASDKIEELNQLLGQYKRQMETNASVAKRFELALLEIAKLCGWTVPEGSCTGVPADEGDIDAIAVRLVKGLL